MGCDVLAMLWVRVEACYVGTGCFPRGWKELVCLLAPAAISSSFVASSILDSVWLHLWKVQQSKMWEFRCCYKGYLQLNNCECTWYCKFGGKSDSRFNSNGGVS